MTCRSRYTFNQFDHHSSSQTLASLDAALATLRTCEEAFEAITLGIQQASSAILNITKHIVERIAETSKSRRSLILTRGLLSLPDDVWPLVFEAALPFQPPRYVSSCWRMGFRLAGVCRRFRAIALRTPSIWSYVKLDMHPDALKTCLKNSGKSGLCIDVLPLKDRWRRDQFDLDGSFKSIARHSKRWERLAIRLDARFASVPRLKMLSKAFKGLTRLRSLTVEVDGEFFPGLDTELISLLDDLSQGASTATSFFMTLNELGGYIPHLPTTLTYLDLTINDMPVDGEGFLTALSSLTVLSGLSLSFLYDADDDDPDYLEDTAFSLTSLTAVSLPSVRSLKIRVYQSSAHFLPFLYFPNSVSLEAALEAHIAKENYEDLQFDRVSLAWRWLSGLKVMMRSMFAVNDTPRYPHLKTIALNMLAEPAPAATPVAARLPSDFLSPVLESCPSLEHLLFLSEFEEQDVILPPVRTLRLPACVNRTSVHSYRHLSTKDRQDRRKYPRGNWVAKYAGQLREAGLWDAFERLELAELDQYDLKYDPCGLKAAYGDKLVITSK